MKKDALLITLQEKKSYLKSISPKLLIYAQIKKEIEELQKRLDNFYDKK